MHPLTQGNNLYQFSPLFLIKFGGLVCWTLQSNSRKPHSLEFDVASESLATQRKVEVCVVVDKWKTSYFLWLKPLIYGFFSLNRITSFQVRNSFLQDQKQVSKSYDYKLKSIIKKKLSNLLDNEIPLLSKLFSIPDHTKISKISNTDNLDLKLNDLTKFSKMDQTIKKGLTKSGSLITKTLKTFQII